MNDMEKSSCKLIVAGVGGQGAITIAQLVLGAAHEDGYFALQSEVHGMSQRGGAVNAHVVFAKREVFSPVVMDGDADLLIALEPLEALRYLPGLKKNAHVITATEPLINMDHYPEEHALNSALNRVEGIQLIAAQTIAKELGNRLGSNIVLLGAAARYMQISRDAWNKALRKRFCSKGEEVIAKNIEAFEKGYSL